MVYLIHLRDYTSVNKEINGYRNGSEVKLPTLAKPVNVIRNGGRRINLTFQHKH